MVCSSCVRSTAHHGGAELDRPGCRGVVGSACGGGLVGGACACRQDRSSVGAVTDSHKQAPDSCVDDGPVGPGTGAVERVGRSPGRDGGGEHGRVAAAYLAGQGSLVSERGSRPLSSQAAAAATSGTPRRMTVSSITGTRLSRPMSSSRIAAAARYATATPRIAPSTASPRGPAAAASQTLQHGPL